MRWWDVGSDIRVAARGLVRAPGYAVTVIVTLALATGANLTAFGIMDGLAYRPLRYLRAPAEVHRLYWEWTDNGRRTPSASTQYTRVVDLRRDARAIADVAAFAERLLPVGDGDQVQQRPVAVVSASYFRFFEGRPARGRYFTDDEDVTPRGADVVVLGYDYWRAAFGGGDVIGQVLRIGDVRATIVGVAPEGFNGLNDGRPPVAFLPITTYAASTGTGDAQTYFSAYKWGWVQVLVRRAAHATPAIVAADATRVFRQAWPRFAADNPRVPAVADADPRVVLAPLRSGAGPSAGPAARTALWLYGLACAVLLIGCANVANLSLARVLSRRRDIEIRLALGIGTARLTALALIEAAMLSIVGGVVAVVVAALTRRALSPVLHGLWLPDVAPLADGRSLTVVAVAILATTLLTGALPAVVLARAARQSLQPTSPGVIGDGRRSRHLLLATQAMLSVMLLVGAGWFARSLFAVQDAPLGYDPRHVLVLTRQIPAGGFDAAMQQALRVRLLEAAEALPEVESAAWMSSAPFVSTSSTDIHLPRQHDAVAGGPFTFQATTGGYFRTMGTRIVRGRPLLPSDTASAPAVAVVSESMARSLWPGADGLGQCFHMRTADAPCRVVVGIAEDIVQRDLGDAPRLHYYVPIDQYPRTFGNGLLLRTRSRAEASAPRILAALQRALPAGYYFVMQPLTDVVADQQASWRLGAIVLTAFAALALVVAGVGLFGSVRFDITQRTREWAVRAALGADPHAVAVMIVRRGLVPIVWGVLPGLVVAALAAPWLEPILYRTEARDPWLFAAATVALLSASLLASGWPALLAARADPKDALRAD